MLLKTIIVASLECICASFVDKVNLHLDLFQEHLESGKYLSRAILTRFLRCFTPLRQAHDYPHSNTSSPCCSTPSFPFPLLLLCPFPFPFFAPFSCSPIATSSA